MWKTFLSTEQYDARKQHYIMYISQIADMSRALLDQCVLGKCVYVCSVLWMSSKDIDVLKDGGRGNTFSCGYKQISLCVQ